MGGGGNRATITVPDYGGYDRMFDMRKDAVMSQINSDTQALQQQVNDSLASITGVKEKIRDFKTAQAEDAARLEDQAQRLSVLMGAPPPEPTAQAPEIGTRERNINTRKGKSSLRIGLKTAKGSAKGTGLNIT
jgi:hypothetical protein